MGGHGGSSAGSYLADPTSPIPSHCVSIVTTSTLRVNHAYFGQSNFICWYLFFDPENLAREISTPEIEYTGPVHERPSRYREKTQKKVRVKSAADEDKVSVSNKRRKKPVPIKERPKWGAKKPVYTKPLKQSERDPFYEKKKQRLEATKAQRAAELKRLTNANSPHIPEMQTVNSRNRSRSRDRTPDAVPHSRSPVTYKRIEYVDTAPPKESSRWNRSNSPPRSKHIGSVNVNRPQNNATAPSPVVPALKNYHRVDDDYNYDQHARVSSRPDLVSNLSRAGNRNNATGDTGTRDKHYLDRNPLDEDKPMEDFAPFIRTQDILDPARADDPLPMSREASRVQRGRRQYRQELDPGRYGNPMRNIDDPRRQQQYDMALEGGNVSIL